MDPAGYGLLPIAGLQYPIPLSCLDRTLSMCVVIPRIEFLASRDYRSLLSVFDEGIHLKLCQYIAMSRL